MLEKGRNIERIDRRASGSEYQSLHHFISASPWDDKPVLAQIAREADKLLGGTPESALIIDPSGFPKKGAHSVGVARQWCGRLGKVDNCQVGVFASLVRGRDACLIDKRLYLPKSWCEDPARCQAAGIPEEEREYKKHADLALELIEAADANGIRYSWIGLDGEFGNFPWFLLRLDSDNRPFLIDVHRTARVYTRNPRLKTAPKRKGKNKKKSQLRFRRKAMMVEALRLRHGKRKWRRRTIRDSSKGELQAEFLHKRVWFWDGKETTNPRLWHLLIRRSLKEDGKTFTYKYSLSNAPAKTKTAALAYYQAQRYWVEHAIRDCKGGIGIDEYQVRKWRAWHHHTTMTILAGLFVQEARRRFRKPLPLLSLTDIREVLEFLLPRKATTLEELAAQILFRHRQRLASYKQARAKAPP